MRPANGPHVSVVIPVHNQAEMLRCSLQSLRESTWTDYETIVVDDGSADSSGDVASSLGSRVIYAERNGGPAKARNLGAQAAQGSILVFLDADVCVHPETLDLLLAPLKDESVDAAFGSYDADPGASNVVSQFRNLLHHYIHQTARNEATTFWAACGAIRKSAFFGVGGFDPSFSCPSVEDIELGLRLRGAARRIVVQRLAQVKHLKRWTLASMCACDLWRRGVPWALLIVREKSLPDDLNVKRSQRWSLFLTLVLVAALLFMALHQPWLLALPLLLLGSILAVDLGGIKVQRVASLAVPPVTGAFGLAGLNDAPIGVAIALASLLGIVSANVGFYRFLCRVRGTSFAINAFPLHLLFYVTCGVAVVIAMVQLAWNAMRQTWRNFERTKVRHCTAVTPAPGHFTSVDDLLSDP